MSLSESKTVPISICCCHLSPLPKHASSSHQILSHASNTHTTHHSMSRSAALVGVLLLLLAAVTATNAQETSLSLTRPEGDCVAPAITSLTSSYNFFPSSYQLQSIQAPSAASSSGLTTTVS